MDAEKRARRLLIEEYERDGLCPIPIVHDGLFNAALRAITRALTQAQPGWRVVPVEATDEMIEAAWDSDAADYVGEHKRIHSLSSAWREMLAAAPAPQQGEGS